MGCRFVNPGALVCYLWVTGGHLWVAAISLGGHLWGACEALMCGIWGNCGALVGVLMCHLWVNCRCPHCNWAVTCEALVGH